MAKRNNNVTQAEQLRQYERFFKNIINIIDEIDYKEPNSYPEAVGRIKASISYVRENINPSNNLEASFER